MELDQVITAVKKETGIKLSAADPVLAAAAINAVLLDAALAKLGQSVETALGKFAALNAQNEAAAKRAASEVINSAADWLGARFKETAQEATAEMLAEMRKETARAEQASRVAVRAALCVGDHRRRGAVGDPGLRVGRAVTPRDAPNHTVTPPCAPMEGEAADRPYKPTFVSQLGVT